MKVLVQVVVTIFVAAFGVVALATSAGAGKTPVGCAGPQLINRAALTVKVGTQMRTVGRLTQYWGRCNGKPRNWAHVHLRPGYRAHDVRLGIQTRNSRLHGVRTVAQRRDFPSDRARTISRDTRAFARGFVSHNGRVLSLPPVTTRWSHGHRPRVCGSCWPG